MTAVAPAPPAPPVQAPAPGRGRRRAALPILARLAAAVAAGAGLWLAFPPYGLWPLAPLAVAVFALVCHGRRVRAGLGYGFVTGLVFFVPLLSWTGLNVGAFPWLLLSTAEAAFLGLLGAAAAFASPLVERHRWTWPLVTGVLWTAQEAARDRAPFGGFPWGRLAFSQADSPALRFASVGGAPLVTFVVAVAGGLLAYTALRLWRTRGAEAAPGRRRAGLAAGGGRAVAAGPTAGGWLVPLHEPAGRSVTVAIVQGNVPRLGLDFNEQRRAVLDNHVQATLRLAAQVAAGQADRPDLVIWPENSSDIDPLIAEDSDAHALISQAADTIGAPILVGAVLDGPGPTHARNAGILWLPQTGPDIDQMYVKRHPVPFAEYMPLRSIARKVTSKVDLVRSDFVAGSTPGVMRTDAGVLGDVICFEVAYDGIVRDTVTGGAQLITVQTNNATFNSAEAQQQLAMVRLRAVEHGRAALMASTVGVSAFVDAHGTVSQATGFNTPSVVVAHLRLGGTRTLATETGPAPEYGLVGLAAIALLAAGLLRWRRRPAAEPPVAEEIQEDQ